MVETREQYETFPYPERDPKDEKKRLIQGSPSHPLEMDHFIWGGRRDWSKPLNALVAGGGTGDGLVQLAAMLTKAKREFQITYVDLSDASRAIAQERCRIRGLKGITFQQGNLLDAPDLGAFDYIDCCGVLHHLPEPELGFKALSKALKPDGGLGFMVYAPLGRSGVYPLQAAFGSIFEGVPPGERLALAKAVFEKLPSGHPFKRNPHLVDHKQSDAGFYDLLLHGQDQAMDVERVISCLDGAGLELASFTEPARYDIGRFLKRPDGLSEREAMGAAENLDGTMKTHVGYARLRRDQPAATPGSSNDDIPHLKSGQAKQIAGLVARTGRVELNANGQKIPLTIPKSAAPLIAMIDGQTSVGKIRERANLDPIAFGSAWGAASKVLSGWGQLWYSQLLLRKGS